MPLYYFQKDKPNIGGVVNTTIKIMKVSIIVFLVLVLAVLPCINTTSVVVAGVSSASIDNDTLGDNTLSIPTRFAETQCGMNFNFMVDVMQRVGRYKCLAGPPFVEAVPCPFNPYFLECPQCINNFDAFVDGIYDIVYPECIPGNLPCGFGGYAGPNAVNIACPRPV